MDGHLRQLEAFVMVYRRGSVTAAAREMHLTQPAVTLMIQKLEGACGVPLFRRRNRALHPTKAADDLVDAAERLVHDSAAFDARLNAIRRATAIQTEIAVTPSIGTFLMPHVFKVFEERFPSVKVLVHDVLPGDAVQLVREGIVEFGIGTFEPRADVELVSIVKYSLLVLCLKTSRLARRRRIAWADVNSLPIIALTPGHAIRKWMDESFARTGQKFVPAIEVSQFASAIAMVQRNIGCTIVPSYLGQIYETQGLVARPVDEPANTRDLFMMKRIGSTLTPAAHELLDLIRNEVERRAAQVSAPRAKA